MQKVITFLLREKLLISKEPLRITRQPVLENIQLLSDWKEDDIFLMQTREAEEIPRVFTSSVTADHLLLE